MSASPRTVTLIGAPTDVGAAERGASMGPEAMRVAGIQGALEARGLRVVDRGNLPGPANPRQPPVDGYRNLEAVLEWCRLVHEAVYQDLRAARQPILLGGAPRAVAIANGTLAAAIGLGLRLWIPGLVIWAIGHAAAVWAAKRDAQFVDVARRHLRYPAYLRV